MKKPKIKKADLKLYFPELYEWVYGKDIPKPPSIPWYKRLKKAYTWAPYLFNSWLNSINYSMFIRKADRIYRKTNIHRHLVPIKKFRLALITGADLTAYNKKAIKRGLKRLGIINLKSKPITAQIP